MAELANEVVRHLPIDLDDEPTPIEVDESQTVPTNLSIKDEIDAVATKKAEQRKLLIRSVSIVENADDTIEDIDRIRKVGTGPDLKPSSKAWTPMTRIKAWSPNAIRRIQNMPDRSKYHLMTFSGIPEVDHISCLDWLEQVMKIRTEERLSEVVTLRLIKRHSSKKVYDTVSSLIRAESTLIAVVTALETQFGLDHRVPIAKKTQIAQMTKFETLVEVVEKVDTKLDNIIQVLITRL